MVSGAKTLNRCWAGYGQVVMRRVAMKSGAWCCRNFRLKRPDGDVIDTSSCPSTPLAIHRCRSGSCRNVPPQVLLTFGVSATTTRTEWSGASVLASIEFALLSIVKVRTVSADRWCRARRPW